MNPEMPDLNKPEEIDPLDAAGVSDGYNKIELNEGALEGSEVGSEVTVSVTGTIEEDEDGGRCLNVSEIDGKPVVSEEVDEEAPDLEENLDEAIKGLNGKTNKF
jgi:hypothetical protein